MTQKISIPMNEEEEKENTAIKVTVEVKNCGERETMQKKT